MKRIFSAVVLLLVLVAASFAQTTFTFTGNTTNGSNGGQLTGSVTFNGPIGDNLVDWHVKSFNLTFNGTNYTNVNSKLIPPSTLLMGSSQTAGVQNPADTRAFVIQKNASKSTALVLLFKDNVINSGGQDDQGNQEGNDESTPIVPQVTNYDGSGVVDDIDEVVYGSGEYQWIQLCNGVDGSGFGPNDPTCRTGEQLLNPGVINAEIHNQTTTFLPTFRVVSGTVTVHKN